MGIEENEFLYRLSERESEVTGIYGQRGETGGGYCSDQRGSERGGEAVIVSFRSGERGEEGQFPEKKKSTRTTKERRELSPSSLMEREEWERVRIRTPQRKTGIRVPGEGMGTGVLYPRREKEGRTISKTVLREASREKGILHFK